MENNNIVSGLLEESWGSMQGELDCTLLPAAEGQTQTERDALALKASIEKDSRSRMNQNEHYNAGFQNVNANMKRSNKYSGYNNNNYNNNYNNNNNNYNHNYNNYNNNSNYNNNNYNNNNGYNNYNGRKYYNNNRNQYGNGHNFRQRQYNNNGYNDYYQGNQQNGNYRSYRNDRPNMDEVSSRLQHISYADSPDLFSAPPTNMKNDEDITASKNPLETENDASYYIQENDPPQNDTAANDCKASFNFYTPVKHRPYDKEFNDVNKSNHECNVNSEHSDHMDKKDENSNINHLDKDEKNASSKIIKESSHYTQKYTETMNYSNKNQIVTDKREFYEEKIQEHIEANDNYKYNELNDKDIELDIDVKKNEISNDSNFHSSSDKCTISNKNCNDRPSSHSRSRGGDRNKNKSRASNSYKGKDKTNDDTFNVLKTSNDVDDEDCKYKFNHRRNNQFTEESRGRKNPRNKNCNNRNNISEHKTKCEDEKK